VALGAGTVDKVVVTNVESLVNTNVWVDVKVDVKVTVDTGTVMLVVNLETEVEMGINRAPLGRLAVLLAGLIVLIARVDGVVAVEDLVAAF
jgi:hypothetical protein